MGRPEGWLPGAKIGVRSLGGGGQHDLRGVVPVRCWEPLLAPVPAGWFWPEMQGSLRAWPRRHMARLAIDAVSMVILDQPRW